MPIDTPIMSKKLTKRCLTKTGCGLLLPITSFSDTPTRKHGSRLCTYCQNKRTSTNIPETITAKTRTCNKTLGCGKTLPITSFGQTPNSKHGTRICLDCINQRIIEYETKIASRREARKQQTATYLDRYTAWTYRLKTRHGMTEEDYFRLLIQQDYQCAICPAEALPNKTGKRIYGTLLPSLYVDQKDKHSPVRGLLCRKCKIMVGNFHDQASTLQSASSYLDKKPNYIHSEVDAKCLTCAQTHTMFKKLPEQKTVAYKEWAKNLNKYYGITPYEYVHQYLEQDKKCSICHILDGKAPLPSRPKTFPELHTIKRHLIPDYRKETKTVQGLLCRDCNWGLSKAEHNIEIVDTTANYLHTAESVED